MSSAASTSPRAARRSPRHRSQAASAPIRPLRLGQPLVPTEHGLGVVQPADPDERLDLVGDEAHVPGFGDAGRPREATSGPSCSCAAAGSSSESSRIPSAQAAIRSACGFPVAASSDGRRGVASSGLLIATVRLDEGAVRDEDRLEDGRTAIAGEVAALIGMGEGPVEQAGSALADERPRQDVHQRVGLAARGCLVQEPVPCRQTSLEVVRPGEHVGKAEGGPGGHLTALADDPLALERPVDQLDGHAARQSLLVASDPT